jgi:hypothetical protein
MPKLVIIPGLLFGLIFGGGKFFFLSETSIPTQAQQAHTKASNSEPRDYVGGSIALSSDGNTLAVEAAL